MGIFDLEYNFDELIRTTSAGVEVSNFVQIREAITRKYKEIFGNDIDTDSTTGDGQYIMMLALMLYNGYYGVFNLNQNIDPASAKGKFLDILCSFNNVTRENQTHSYADLYVKYIGNSTGEYVSTFGSNPKIQKIECIDQAGNIWTWEEGKQTEGFKTKFTKDSEPVQLTFVCETPGKIIAQADKTLSSLKEITSISLNSTNHGWISKVVDTTNYPFEVWQAADAIVGQEEESDESLRKRRLREIGNSGLTVLSSLIGGLLSINGVEEVKIYNNVTENEQPWQIANDGSHIYYHDVYICIRYKEGVIIEDSQIGKKIYEKMTPGIITTPYNEYPLKNNTYGKYKQIEEGPYGYTKNYQVTAYNQILKYNVYWKRCKSISPSMKLDFLYNPDIYKQKSARENIENTIKEYTKKLTIYDNLTIPNLLYAINSSDNPVNNQNTFIFLNGKITEENTNKEKLLNDLNESIGYYIKANPENLNLYLKDENGEIVPCYDKYFTSSITYYNNEGEEKTPSSLNLYVYSEEDSSYILSLDSSFDGQKQYYSKTYGGVDTYENKDTYFNYDNMKFEFVGDDTETVSSATYKQAILYIYSE